MSKNKDRLAHHQDNAFMWSDMSISTCALLFQWAYAIKTHSVSCEKINYSNSDTVYILAHNYNVEAMLFLRNSFWLIKVTTH